MLHRLPRPQIALPKTAETNSQGLPKPSVLQILSNWIGHQLDVQELRRLLAMDERMLSDIGLTRSDLLAEYRRLSTMSWTTRIGHPRLKLNELRRDDDPVSKDQSAGHIAPVPHHAQQNRAIVEATFMPQRYRR